MRQKFNIGQWVTHITDPNCLGMVMGIYKSWNGVTYRVVWPPDREEETHYAEELVMRSDKEKPAPGFCGVGPGILG